MHKERIKKVEKVEKEKDDERNYLEVKYESSNGNNKKQVFDDPERYLEKCDCCGKPKFHHDLDKADIPAEQTQEAKKDLTSDVLNRFK